MIDTEEPSEGLDIGVVRDAGEQGDGSNAPRPSRLLTRWGLIVIALFIGLLVGVVVGLVVGGSDGGPVAPREASDSALEGVVPDRGAPGADAGPIPTRTIPLPSATLVIAQLAESGQLPLTITSVDVRGSSTTRVDDDIPRPTSLVDPVGRRSLMANDTLVFVAAGQAHTLRVGPDEPAQVITEATTLLSGPGSGNVWGLSADARTVQLIDVAGRRVAATYDLSTVGTPLASHSGGLVVAPDIERFGAFALWSPARGIERLWPLDDQAMFIDAGGNAIVVQTAQGIATYNTVTGALTQTERMLTGGFRALLSPDGALLAVAEPPANGSNVVVSIIDLASGETIDQFGSVSPRLLTWAANNAILYVPPGDTTKAVLRNMNLGFDTVLVDLDPDLIWMVLAGL